MEKSVRTRPPRGDRDYCVPGPRQHTPHSCARGWTFKTFPLTPPGAAPVARLASLGDAEPCCHPFLRTLRFSGTRCVACGSGSRTPKMPLASHAYQRWAQRCVCVCALLFVSPSPGSFYPLHATKDLEPIQASHGCRTTNGCPSPTSVPSSPSAGRTRLCTPLCVLGASARLTTHGSAGVCFLWLPGSGCARLWDTPLPGSSQPSLPHPSALKSRRSSSQWLSWNSA